MRAQLQYLWFLTTSSLWLVPGAMIVGAVALALLTLALDDTVEMTWLLEVPWLLKVEAEGARQFLATVATAAITVASLVFSMTLVALTLASSQLGPRVINRFMSDRVNQVVLGTFVATFLYALLILQTVTGGGEDGPSFVPRLSLFVTILLTTMNLVWLVYFIHHVANAIQADVMVAHVSEQLHGAIDERFPQIDPDSGGPAEAAFLDILARPCEAVFPRQAGYIQAIDAAGMLKNASEHDLVIRVEHRPGDFVMPGTAILRVWPEDALSPSLAHRLRQAVVIGRKRTPTQDIEFAISELQDIALRAMSPSINDPYTAVACVDRLGEGVADLMRREEPLSLIADREGTLRLICSPVTFDGALDAAFSQIRQFGTHYFVVLMRLLEILATLARFIRTEEQRAALTKQAAIVSRACRAVMEDEADRDEAERRIATLDELLRGAYRDGRERALITA